MDFQKLEMSLILRGVRLSRWASEPLMAFLMMLLCSEQERTLSRMFCSNSLQLMSTCSVLYFLRRLTSSVERVATKASTGMAKRTSQPWAVYLDLNLLLEMISSSPKKSKRVSSLRLWKELQTARTYHLRAGSGHLLCSRMQMWFSSCTLPLNTMQKNRTSSPASAMVCPSKQNWMLQSRQKVLAFLSLRCSSAKKVLLSISPISSLSLVSMSSRSLASISWQTGCLSTSRMDSSLQATASWLRPQKHSLSITSFFCFAGPFFPGCTLPTKITARNAGTPPGCTTSPALQYCVVRLPRMSQVTTGGSSLKKGICCRYKFTKQRQSLALSAFQQMRGIDISLLQQFWYIKSMNPSFCVSHAGYFWQVLSSKSMALAQGKRCGRRKACFSRRDVCLGVLVWLRFILLSITLRKCRVQCIVIKLLALQLHIRQYVADCDGGYWFGQCRDWAALHANIKLLKDAKQLNGSNSSVLAILGNMLTDQPTPKGSAEYFCSFQSQNILRSFLSSYNYTK